MTVKELREKRLALKMQGQALVDRSEKENRELTSEEFAQWQAIESELTAIRGEIDKAEKAAMRARLDEEERALQKPSVTAPRPAVEAREFEDMEWAVRGRFGTFDQLPPGERADIMRRCTAEYMAEYRHFLRTGETRAMLATSDAHGGFLAPPAFMAQLLSALDDVVHIRARATVLPVTSGVALGCPSLTEDLDDAEWTSESPASLTYDDMKFGRRELRPHPLIKGVKVSRKLLRASAVPVESVVAQRFAVRFGRAMENAYLVGSGVGQPLGLFTPSSDGVSTSRDVESAASTAIGYEDIVDLVGKVKSQYRSGAVFLMHRDVLTALRKIKDGDNRYIWQPSLSDSQPDRLLGYPVIESEFAPSTIAADNYTILFGNLRYYWIADSLGLEIVMTDKYLENNLNAYIGFAETDGMPIDPNAFARLKMKSQG